MSHRFTRALAILSLAALPTLASAQIEKGDSQISLQGSLSTQLGQPGSSSTSGSIGGSYGYYVTRQLALRGTAYISMSAGVGGGSSTSAVYGGGIELNLTGANQSFVPYLAFDALTSTMSGGSSSSSNVLLGPSVGARAFVSRNTAFNVALQYQTTSDNTSTGTLQTLFGFSFFFGGDGRR